MNIAIIASSKDPAGINIRNNLIELFDFEKSDEKFDKDYIFRYDKIQNKKIKLYLISDELVHAENIGKRIDADAFIFASKHNSKEAKPSFSVHPIGNWGKAELGGRERMLSMSSGFLLKKLFVELNNNVKNLNYELTMEVTHHGPYIEKPATFIEIGSTEKEWKDNLNGKIISESIMNAISNRNNNYKTAIGIGGPHYCSNFNKVLLRTDIALSHICPKYLLNELNQELISQAIEKTAEKVDFILLDWKGLGTEKQRIADLLKNLNLEIKRTDKILKD